MKKVLVAGGSGYLGQYVIKALSKAGFHVKAVVRSEKKMGLLKPYIDELIIADIGKPEELAGMMDGIDLVFSSVGITRQKDGLTYMDVDYQCNRNLLDEALVAGVDKFMYVSAVHGDKIRELKIAEAKEKFVDELVTANIKAYIMRPSGFFSDITDFFNMAKKGKVYLFGKGGFVSNPIHGEDLATFCVEKMEDQPGTYPVGGPDLLTQRQIAELAFDALGMKHKITSVPVFAANATKWFLRNFTKQTFYGPIEFFLTVLTMDMKAPTYGQIHLGDYFKSLVEKDNP